MQAPPQGERAFAVPRSLEQPTQQVRQLSEPEREAF